MSVLCRSVGDACGRQKKKMVRALSVWADALQFETTCIVKLVRHAEELGAGTRSCGANILCCSLRENRTQNAGRRNMWDEKKYIIDRSVCLFSFVLEMFFVERVQLHYCAVFQDNLCCCATADVVQDIIRVVAVVHALHPGRDPQIFLLEHKSFQIHERLRNSTTKILRLGADTREGMHRDLHPHREDAIHASFG